MKKLLIGILITLLPFWSLSYPIVAQTTQTRKKITFSAPTNRKRIQQRISSSMSRGCQKHIPQVTLLTPPDHVGQTVSRQVEVFLYFKEKPTDIPIYLTLSQYNDSQAIIEKPIHIEKEGVTKIRLPIELKVGQVYQWSITLICQSHPKRIDENEEISGLIERVILPAAVSEKIDKASLSEQANLYAGLGIWYESLRATQNLPQFNELLEQAGINLSRN